MPGVQLSRVTKDFGPVRVIHGRETQRRTRRQRQPGRRRGKGSGQRRFVLHGAARVQSTAQSCRARDGA